MYSHGPKETFLHPVQEQGVAHPVRQKALAHHTKDAVSLQHIMSLSPHDFVFPHGYTHLQMQEISNAGVCSKNTNVP
jgi:hypothetical protein